MSRNILPLLFAISIIFPARLSAQTKFLPTIIALFPRESNADSTATIELKHYQKSGVVTEQLRKQFLRDGLAPNWKMIREKELAFMDDQDFISMFLLSLTRELTYKEMENRTNLLIYPSRETSDNALASYKKIADQYKVSWVINLVRSEATAQGEKRILKITIQLYNAVTNRLFLDKQYISDSMLALPTETCSDTWLCLAEYIQKAAVVDIADKVEKNIRHERM